MKRHDLLTDIKFCSIELDLHWGKAIHAKAVECHIHLDLHIVNGLINMYRRCGSMVDAHKVFDEIDNLNVVSWNTLVSGYAESGEARKALEIFSRMEKGGYPPDSVTYLAALKACTSLVVSEDSSSKEECLRYGREIHSEIGCHLNRYLENTLIYMYSKCGSMVEARNVFKSMNMPDVVSWNALLMGYAENGQGCVTLNLFDCMKAAGHTPNCTTYMAPLKACTTLAVDGNVGDSLSRGRAIHSEIDCHLDSNLQTSLIDMYSNCGSMTEARQVFENIQKPNVVHWNALLLGYAENEKANVTVDLFWRMKERGFSPDSVTYIAALKACTILAINGDDNAKRRSLELGKAIHLEAGSQLSQNLQNTLIDMYASCGSMTKALEVFQSIPKPNVISWSALLMGYVENGNGHRTLDLFAKMKSTRCKPNAVTYVAVLRACGSIGALSSGRKLNSEISEFTAEVVTCLVDFYAKCGSILEAQNAFDSHTKLRTVPTWNALIAGYGRLGESDSVFKLFEAMQDEGLRPNGVTFLCVLLCCSHAGLVERATWYFEAMSGPYGVTPSLKHYNCMVDVLGRANQIDKAVDIMRRMACDPDAVTWTTLMCACRKWKNVEIGRKAFLALAELKKCSSHYVLMAEIYGDNKSF